MREIKFRAWHKAEKKMYGNPENTCWVEMLRVSGEAGFDECDVDLTTENGEGQSVSFDEVVLMQYTGLHDKNGKEIYEGDILNHKALRPSPNGGWYLESPSFQRENAGMVKYENGQYILETDYLLYDKRLSRNLRDDRFKTFEVIGNIYENPELFGAK